MTAHVYKIIADIRQEIRDEGIQEGFQAGRQEGIQAGRQEGIQAGRQEGIQAGRAAPLIRALGRKLGAPLSEQEREVVLGRLALVDDDTLADLIADVLGGRVQPVVQFLGLEQAAL